MRPGALVLLVFMLSCGGSSESAPPSSTPAPVASGLNLAGTPYSCFTVADVVALTRELNRRAADGYALAALSSAAADSGGNRIHACVFRPSQEPPAPIVPKKPPKSTANAFGFNTGIPECDLYIERVSRYIECDKVPDQARSATKKGLEQMRGAWANMRDMPKDAQRAAADGCKQAVAALEKGAEALGCPL